MTPVACVPYREARWLRDTNEPVTLKHTHTHTWSCNCRSYDKQSFLLGDQFTHTHTHTHTRIHTYRHWFTQTPPHTYMIDTYTLSVSLSLSITHTHTRVMTINALPVTKGRSTDDIGVELWPVPVTHHGPHTIIEHLQSAFIPTTAANQSHWGCGCDAYKDMTEKKMCSQLVLITWYSDSPATLKMELCHWNWFECVNVFVMQSFKHTLKQHPR